MEVIITEKYHVPLFYQVQSKLKALKIFYRQLPMMKKPFLFFQSLNLSRELVQEFAGGDDNQVHAWFFSLLQFGIFQDIQDDSEFLRRKGSTGIPGGGGYPPLSWLSRKKTVQAAYVCHLAHNLHSRSSNCSRKIRWSQRGLCLSDKTDYFPFLYTFKGFDHDMSRKAGRDLTRIEGKIIQARIRQVHYKSQPRPAIGSICFSIPTSFLRLPSFPNTSTLFHNCFRAVSKSNPGAICPK